MKSVVFMTCLILIQPFANSFADERPLISKSIQMKSVATNNPTNTMGAFQALRESIRQQQKMTVSTQLAEEQKKLKQANANDYKNIQQQIRALQMQQEKIGGSTDGGGNAVGYRLFDFYESDGAVEVGLKDLFLFSPEFKNILEKLNGVGILKENKFFALGNLVAKEISKKKIILDTKELIQSDACLNKSAIVAKNQEVVACQDEVEIRFNLNWLAAFEQPQLKEQKVNQTGLIAHEAVLAWVKSLKTSDTKEDLEKKVRFVNRAVFKSGPATDLIEEIKDQFEIKLIEAESASQIIGLNIELVHDLKSFCKSANAALPMKVGQLMQQKEKNHALNDSEYLTILNEYFLYLPETLKIESIRNRIKLKENSESDFFERLKQNQISDVERKLIKPSCLQVVEVLDKSY